jgi:hypothetical protein
MEIEGVGQRAVEHALELRRVLEAAGLLELRDHRRLRVVRARELLDEALGEHLGVELLEDVLVLDVLEDGHLCAQTSALGPLI